jgi:hypothetical protein
MFSPYSPARRRSRGDGAYVISGALVGTLLGDPDVVDLCDRVVHLIDGRPTTEAPDPAA